MAAFHRNRCSDLEKAGMHSGAITFRIKSAIDAAALPLYWLRGRKPWSVGYNTTKRRAIEAAIDQHAVTPGKSLPAGFGVALDERVVEYPWLFGHLSTTGKQKPRVLDAGSILNHDFILNRAPIKGSDLTIMTLAPEKYCQWYSGVSYVYGDLRETFFNDQTFDIVLCISTIEHIGLDNTLLYTSDQQRAERDDTGFLAAAREFRRILKPGGTCYISFPFGARQNLGWYQVFDRAMVAQLVDAFGPASHEIEYFRYSVDGWQRSDAESAKEAVVFDVHSGQGRGDDRAASSRAIACLRLVA
jgi:SAM-dependent methyltransferase